MSKNTEVSSWWKGSSKSNSSSLHSMMFEDNVGEDRPSAHLTLLISMTKIILIIWHPNQQCSIGKVFRDGYSKEGLYPADQCIE